MSFLRQRLIDLMSMSRFANLPTVWSNVLLGLLIGSLLRFFQLNQILLNESSTSEKVTQLAQAKGLSLLQYPILFVSASLLYLGGCFLNDWKDAPFDTIHKSDRPIPSGRVRRSLTLVLAVSLLIGGLALSSFISLSSLLVALLIILSILAYTQWHKVHPASLIFMASARGLLYFFAIFAVIPAKSLWQIPSLFTLWGQRDFLSTTHWLPSFYPYLLAFGLASYILGISLFARHESRRDQENFRPTFFLRFLFLVPLLTHLSITAERFSTLTYLLAVPPFLLALAHLFFRYLRERSIGAFVSRSLGFIPLVDLLAATVAIATLHQSGTLALPYAILLYLSFIAFSALGFFLQKIAPAT